MKMEEELVKSANEASALVRETTEIFKKSIGVYFLRVTEQLRAAVATAENGKISAQGQRQIATVSEEMVVVRKMIERHKAILQRSMKVAIHKGAAKAYDRLEVALERLNEESKDFQEKLRKLASGK
jgi:hypothetical protein